VGGLGGGADRGRVAGVVGERRGGGERRGRAGVVAADARRDRRVAGVVGEREGAGGRGAVHRPREGRRRRDAGGDAAGGGGRVAGHRRRRADGCERPSPPRRSSDLVGGLGGGADRGRVAGVVGERRG